MIDFFTITDVNKAASRFDMSKLAWLNQHYLKQDDPASLAPELTWHLQRTGIDVSQGPDPEAVVVALRDRVHTLKEMAERARIWYAPIAEWDEKAIRKHLRNATAEKVLQAALANFANLPDWNPDAIKAIIHTIAHEQELGMGKVAQPLRVAMTGSGVSPSIEHTVYLAGRNEAIRRIEEALSRR